MAEKEEPEFQDVDLQGMLVKRLLVAGGLVGVLLATLAIFDHLATPDDAPDLPVYTRPVPVAPKKELSQPVTPAAEAPLPAIEVVTPDEPGVAEAPPAPEVTARPEIAPAPAVQPAKPGRPTAAPVVAATPAPPAPAIPEGTAAPVTAAPIVTIPSPAKPAAPSKPVETERPVSPLASPVRPASGYVVQAGVFSSTKATEELHAKLTLNGIPSTLETRVQIGPFKNRAEAEAARQKLKTLGIEGMMIPPAGRR